MWQMWAKDQWYYYYYRYVSWEDLTVGKDGMEKLLREIIHTKKKKNVEQLLSSHNSHGCK